MKRPDWTYGLAYRIIMRLAHRFNWHYAPPIYPDRDTMLWCKWCGFRQVINEPGKLREEIRRHTPADEGGRDG